jgi:DNA polymerase-3 subunit epsilon
MTAVLIVDCETTGIGEKDEPISIGLISFKADAKGLPMGEPIVYEGFRYPSVPVHPKAQQVHGMSRESLKDRDFDHGRVASMLEKADVLIAHNAQFDSRMIGRLYPAALEKKWRCSWKQWPWPTGAENKKLDSACKLFNVERPATHGALKDAQALLNCLLQRSGKTERSSTYLRKLLDRTDAYIGKDYPRDWSPESVRLEFRPETSARGVDREPRFKSADAHEPKPSSSILRLIAIVIGAAILAKCVA